MNFSLIYLILPAAIGLGFTKPLRVMGTGRRKIMFLGNRARPVSKADNLTAIFEPIV
jgi:hypothetical protein